MRSKRERWSCNSINEAVLGVADEDDWEIDEAVGVDEVIAAIDELPNSFRVVVQLFLLEGYDHKEISEILGISESASRTNLHRGKQLLKKNLKHLQYGTGY